MTIYSRVPSIGILGNSEVVIFILQTVSFYNGHAWYLLLRLLLACNGQVGNKSLFLKSGRGTLKKQTLKLNVENSLSNKCNDLELLGGRSQLGAALQAFSSEDPDLPKRNQVSHFYLLLRKSRTCGVICKGASTIPGNQNTKLMVVQKQ